MRRATARRPLDAMPRQIYTAEYRIDTLPHTLRAMARGMLQSRYLGYRLAVRSIKGRYAKSAFGMFWDLIDPLILGLIFYGLMQARVIQPGDMGMPYALFVIYGLFLYATFTEALMEAVEVFGRSRGLLTQQKIPPEALLTAIFFSVGFNGLFRLAVMAGFSVVLQGIAVEQGQITLSVPGLLAFFALSPLIIFAGVSIGLFLAPFNAIYSDVGRVTRIVLTPLRYVSPVLWPIPATGAIGLLNYCNPLSSLIGDLRLLAVSGSMATPELFVGWCAALAVLFLLAWFVFHLAVPVLAERA